MPLAPAFRLGPYEIVELLSVGGMGEVYRARDTRLGRQVAVKILPPAFADDPQQIVRFEQEAQAAGALNHPNIVAVHDVGSHDGIAFVVSELIEGVTLREKLRAGLPRRVALEYAAQVARGLAAAHAAGIVHRDLKPENVMVLDDDRVKIVDFGIAKRRVAVAGTTSQAQTGAQTLPGVLVGTIAYMSPEQVRGEAVDHRSDIFSLGLILYESLAGRHPFGQPTVAETMSAILRDEAPPLAGVDADTDLVVRRALEKSREARFQSALEMARALESLVDSRFTPLPVPARFDQVAESKPRTIAVLPFVNLSSEQESEYFSDGLTEELIQALVRVRGLHVVAWHSAVQLKGRERDAQALGRDLNVSTVLAGTVRRARDRVRIAVRLVDVASGYILWSETYDRRLEDVFGIQEEIARAIVDTLTRTLAGPRVPALAARRSTDVEAYNHYLKGRFFWNKRTAEGLTRSVECFEAALAIDEGFALAHAGLADALCLLTDYGIVQPGEVMPRARAAAIRALELDPRSAEAHVSFAYIRSVYDWEWLEAEALYRRAIELGPGYATARHWFAIDFLAMHGRFEEAAEQAELARQLDPLSMIIQESRGYLLMLARRYDEAIAAYQSLLELDSSFFRVYTSMGRAYLQKGLYAEAAAMLEKGRSMAGDMPNILGALGQARAMGGQRDEARRLLDLLSSMAARRHVPATCFALIHAGLGEHDRAVEWLERGCALHELPVVGINVHPAYDALRDHPRFPALLRKMRFGIV